MDKLPVKQEFTPEELDDIREIALYLKKYKHSHALQQIMGWAINEFLRRRYIRSKRREK